MSETTPFKYDYESQEDGADHSTNGSRLSHDTAVQQQQKHAAKHHPSHTEYRQPSRLRDISLLISIIGNICLSIAFFVAVVPSLRRSDCSPVVSENVFHASSKNPLDIAIPGVEDNIWIPVRFGWDYYAATVDEMDQVDKNWDAINPDVGVVSIPHEELDRWGVSKLQSLPSNSSFGFHFMQGYHSLHCLKIIRQTLLEFAKGVTVQEIKFGHVMHCLAGLLEDTICYADSSMPLRPPEDIQRKFEEKGVKPDFEYMRICRNWSAMSEWATPRTSCMLTKPDGILDRQHEVPQEECARNDGILVPKVFR